ncbi:MAG: OmpA family protein [Bacteroidota bacterium]|nr:OmpA family protein [Bacteroidota bacterium]
MKTSFRFLKCMILAITLTFVCQYSQAQFLKRLKNKITQTAADHVTNDAGNATDKAIDKTEGAVKGGGNSSDNSSGSSNSSSDNSVASSGNAAAPPSLKSYQNYDFVPGDTVLFADDFSTDQEGEFPAHWSLISGQGTVNKNGDKYVFNILNGNYAKVRPRMKTANYLGDAFTIEFDLFPKNGADCGNGANVFFTDPEDPDGGKFINVGGYKTAASSYFPHDLEGVQVKQSDEDFWNHWHHIAIAYKKPQMKVYIDQNRVLVLPDIEFQPLGLVFGGLSGENNCPISITNVRVASGGHMNMIGKKFTESKIITHGITFDVDKTDIKPESMGTLNMIVGVMKDNPNLKFEIDGHTDNTGAAAHNLTLSQERADAVKAQLIKMGIDGSRLTTKGFGDTKPISDNDSPEGKANNRRVEFVKM